MPRQLELLVPSSESAAVQAKYHQKAHDLVPTLSRLLPHGGLETLPKPLDPQANVLSAAWSTAYENFVVSDGSYHVV